MNRTASRILLAIAFSALAVSPPAVFAHKVTAVSVVTELDTKEQTYEVEMAMDVDPTGDPAIDDVTTPEQAAITFATEALVVYFDEVAIEPGTPEVEIVTESDEDTPVELRQQKAIITLKGEIPKGSANFMLYVDESTEAAAIMVVIKDGKMGRRVMVLYPGEFSNPENIEPVIEEDPFPEKQSWGWVLPGVILLGIVAIGIIQMVRRRG